jgi:hypothetical protein
MRDPLANTGGLGLPPLPRWGSRLLMGLATLWIAELLAANFLHLPLYDWFVWRSFGHGFGTSQLLTRYFVQGNDVTGVVFSGLALFFALPLIDGFLTRRQTAWAGAAVVIGGSAVGMALDAIGIVGGAGLGWSVFATAAFTIIGLANPDREIRLFFVLPVKGILFAYGAGVLAVLFILAWRSLTAADHLGAWAGVMAWWYLVGPGSRRRKLISKSRKIERDLARFQVLQGGRNRDDIVH